jgi:hypothetical protein
MGRKLTALIAAGTLVLAACGDDSGDDEEESPDTEEEEVIDSGTDEIDAGADSDLAGDDEVAAFCDSLESFDEEQVAQATPPADIAEAWDEFNSDPENVDPNSPAALEVGNWITENCVTGAGAGATDDTGDSGPSALDDDFMEDFCVEVPEGVDVDHAC